MFDPRLSFRCFLLHGRISQLAVQSPAAILACLMEMPESAKWQLLYQMVISSIGTMAFALQHCNTAMDRCVCAEVATNPFFECKTIVEFAEQNHALLLKQFVLACAQSEGCGL